MRSLLLALLTALVLLASCGGDADLGGQPATEEGAVAAAEQLQSAALRADADGIRRGLSRECLDTIDEEEFRAAIAFMRLFTAELDLDDLDVRVEVTEFEGDRAELEISYVDGDGQPVEDTDGGFTLSADDMTLVHDGSRWVAEDCGDFSSSDSGPGECLDDAGDLGECPPVTVAGRDDPVPLGEAAYVGEGWVVRVTAVDFDAVDTIEAESGYEPDLDPGVQAVLFDLEMAYVGDEGPRGAFDISMGGVGASSVAIDSYGCGFLPNEIDGSATVFTGGVLTGQRCLPTPADDIDSVLLYAEVFGDDRVFFDLRGEPVEGQVPTATGAVEGTAHHDDRQSPTPVGQAAEAGDWTVTVTDVDFDATETVLAASEFNDEAPEGSVYVLVGYDATFDGDEASSSNDARPDLLTTHNVSISSDCSVTLDDEFDAFAEVFPGGTLSGVVCFEVPEDDVDGLMAFVQPDFYDSDITFLALR